MKRYDIFEDEDVFEGYRVDEATDGEWVRYEDAQAAQAQSDERIAELEAEVKRLKQARDQFKTELQCIVNEGLDWQFRTGRRIDWLDSAARLLRNKQGEE